MREGDAEPWCTPTRELQSSQLSRLVHATAAIDAPVAAVVPIVDIPSADVALLADDDLEEVIDALANGEPPEAKAAPVEDDEPEEPSVRPLPAALRTIAPAPLDRPPVYPVYRDTLRPVRVAIGVGFVAAVAAVVFLVLPV